MSNKDNLTQFMGRLNDSHANLKVEVITLKRLLIDKGIFTKEEFDLKIKEVNQDFIETVLKDSK